MAGFGCRVTSRTKYQSSVTNKAVVKELFIYLFIYLFIHSFKDLYKAVPEQKQQDISPPLGLSSNPTPS